MIREITIFSATQQPSVIFILPIILVRFSLPFVLRYIQYGSAIHDFKWDSWLYSVLEILIGILVVYQNYLFIFGGYIDFNRRVNMLAACSVTLDPMKENYHPIYRQFPTINIACSHTIYTWFQMRTCLMDLGRKYMSRVFMYSSTFLGCYLFYLVLILLQFFGFFDVGLSFVGITIAMFDIIFVLGVNLAMLNCGA